MSGHGALAAEAERWPDVSMTEPSPSQQTKHFGSALALLAAMSFGCSHNERRFDFPSRAASAIAACQPSKLGEVAPLECFCAGNACPRNLDNAVATLAAECRDDSCTVLRTDDACGLTRIAVGTGFIEVVYIYRRVDGALIGAEHFVDCCRRFNVISTGLASCTSAKSCVLAGRRTPQLARLQVCPK